MSNEIINKIDEILKNVEIPDRSTFFQLKNFVIGSEPTLHGQIWACIRNLQERRDNIDMLSLQIEDLKDDLQISYIQEKAFSDSEIDVISKRKHGRQIQAIKKNINKLNNKLKYILEEVDYLTAALNSLIEANGGEILPLDDPQAQKSYWNEKLTEEVNLCFLLNRPLNSELVKTILNISDDMPVKNQLNKVFEQVRKNLLEQQKGEDGR